MAKAKRPKSIRLVMTEVGRAADAKLDEISKSVKQHDKDIADIKKMVKEIKSSLSKMNHPPKKKAAAKKKAGVKKTPAKKPRKRTARKKKNSLFPY